MNDNEPYPPRFYQAPQTIPAKMGLVDKLLCAVFVVFIPFVLVGLGAACLVDWIGKRKHESKKGKE